MNASFKLTARDIPTFLRAGYKGRKFRAEITETVAIDSQAGTWDGGSRDTFKLFRLEDGAELSLTSSRAPWDAARHDVKFAIPAGCVVVRHSIFCGRDAGLTFYVGAQDSAGFRRDETPALPA